MLDISLFLLGLNVNEHALPNGTAPTIFLDFKNGVYTSEGVSTTVGALLTQNVDWGSWLAASIHAGVGLVGGSNSNPVFTGAAFDLVSSGATILVALSGNDTSGGSIRYEMVDDLNEFNLDYFCRWTYSENVTSQISDGVTNDDTEIQLANGAHLGALTMIDGKVARSTDGAPTISINPALAWTGIEPTVMGFIVPGSTTIESIGLYPAQADGDLPALSANGNPYNTVKPVVSGTAQVGQTLTSTTGTWAHTPTGYAYNWVRGSFVIGGATASTYMPTEDDIDSTLSCIVTATNAAGGSRSKSLPTTPVIAA